MFGIDYSDLDDEVTETILYIAYSFLEFCWDLYLLYVDIYYFVMTNQTEVAYFSVWAVAAWLIFGVFNRKSKA